MSLYSLFFWFVFAIFGLYVRLKFVFRVNKPSSMPKGAKIFVANHPTVSDPFLLSKAIKQFSHILVAEEVFKIKPVGSLLRRLGCICVVPKRGNEAYQISLELLKKGHSVMIFPEGHLSHMNGEFLHFRSGATRLAMETGAPIIPAGIHVERTRIKTLKMKSGEEDIPAHIYFGGPYTISFGEPMYFSGDTADYQRVRDLTDTLEVQIASLVKQSERSMVREFGPRVLQIPA